MCPRCVSFSVALVFFFVAMSSSRVGYSLLGHAAKEKRQPRASGALGQHLCEVMQGMLDSPGIGQFVDIKSTCSRPAILLETQETGLNVNLGINS